MTCLTRVRAIFRAQDRLIPSHLHSERAQRSKSRWIAVAVVVVALPATTSAMEMTCAGCLDSCCNWAFSAQTALYSRAPSIEAYSRSTWERYGYEPVPCRDVVTDREAYQKCVNKAFRRCYSTHCRGCRLNRAKWGVSGTKPVKFYSGKTIVIKKDREGGKKFPSELSRSIRGLRPPQP